MLKFKEYITEQKEGYLSIFDIDDTLFHTTAQIIIRKSGKADAVAKFLYGYGSSSTKASSVFVKYSD